MAKWIQPPLLWSLEYKPNKKVVKTGRESHKTTARRTPLGVLRLAYSAPRRKFGRGRRKVG